MYFDEDKSPVNSVLSSLPFTILWTALLLLFLFDLNKTIKHWTCLPRRVVRFVHWTEKLDEVSLLIFKFQPGSPGADKAKVYHNKLLNSLQPKINSIKDIIVAHAHY